MILRICDLEAYQKCCNVPVEAYQGVVTWTLTKVLRLRVVPSLIIGHHLLVGVRVTDTVTAKASQPLKKYKNRRSV